MRPYSLNAWEVSGFQHVFRLATEADPVFKACVELAISYAQARVSMKDDHDWIWTLRYAIGDANPQNIPKKLYKKMQRAAHHNRILAATSEFPFVRNLLKPFKWKYSPDRKLHVTHEDMQELEKLHTVQLLSMLQETRRAYNYGSAEWKGKRITASTLKHILKDRPHIPNQDQRRKNPNSPRRVTTAKLARQSDK